ncbi:glycosyltransferase family A protein [Aurantimonas sp. VKM B-3413]|uniref:glycosyltransferase family A protein n=1 Tax=Aurantimonas sp. VKM B-3413 TaxID=2779401 RepID=UPI00351D1834|nr:glycosyltransferase family 2 protein [Aurantimonas sp. VKM B-3413]
MAYDISVVIPCFGQARYLADAVASLRAQTFVSWRCAIVFDEAESGECVRFATKGDCRFVPIRTTRAPTPAARNLGLSLLSSQFIVVLDADDMLCHSFFERATACLLAHQEAKIVYGRARLFGAAEGEFDVPPYDGRLLRERNMIYSSAMFRKVDFDRVGGYDENLSSCLEDWDLWLGILADGGRAIRLDTVELLYRQHARSKTSCVTPVEWKRAYTYIRMKHKQS